MKLVSACLLGIKCRYDGKSKPESRVINLAKKDILIPVCPEQLGGLPTPREPAGIYKGLGEDVLKDQAKVKTVRSGKNVTEHFLKGAQEVLKIAKLLNANTAILKQRSPSCGRGETWKLDSQLNNRIAEGDGVTAALLKRSGIKIMTEDDL